MHIITFGFLCGVFTQGIAWQYTINCLYGLFLFFCKVVVDFCGLQLTLFVTANKSRKIICFSHRGRGFFLNGWHGDVSQSVLSSTSWRSTDYGFGSFFNEYIQYYSSRISSWCYSGVLFLTVYLWVCECWSFPPHPTPPAQTLMLVLVAKGFKCFTPLNWCLLDVYAIVGGCYICNQEIIIGLNLYILSGIQMSS